MINQEEAQLTGKTDSEETQIMVVDDEENIVIYMKSELEDHGYSVTGCTDPEQAIEKIKKEVYDLIIIDLNMPRIPGVEFVKKAKEISPKTDLVVMTGFPAVETAVEFMKNGAADYLAKKMGKNTLCVYGGNEKTH